MIRCSTPHQQGQQHAAPSSPLWKTSPVMRELSPYTTPTLMASLSSVVWQRTFERLGFSPLRVGSERRSRRALLRDRNARTAANRSRVQAALPDRLFVLDLGNERE